MEREPKISQEKLDRSLEIAQINCDRDDISLRISKNGRVCLVSAPGKTAMQCHVIQKIVEATLIEQGILDPGVLVVPNVDQYLLLQI